MMRELLQRVRYRIDEIFARELAGQLLIFLILVSALSVIGATSVFFGLFDPENQRVTGTSQSASPGLLEGMWWSLLQVLNLPGFKNAQGASLPIVAYAFVLSLASLAVFALLISMIRTAIARRIEALTRGDTRVKEHGHLLILGWSSKLIAIVQQIEKLAPELTIAILSADSVRVMQERLRLAGINRRRPKIVLRTGRPSESQELSRMAVDHAACVIVLSADRSDQGRPSDSEVLKVITLLANRNSWTDGPPSVVCEISDVRNHDLAQLASLDRLFLVKSSRVIAKVLAQSAFYPGLSGFYRQLFDADINRLHVSFHRRYQGRSIGDLHPALRDTVLLGTVSSEHAGDWTGYQATLNPPLSHDVAENEGIVYLSRNPEPPVRPATERISQAPVTTVMENKPTRGTGRLDLERFLILGWNNEIYDVVRELREHSTGSIAVTIISPLSPEQASERFRSVHMKGIADVDLQFVKAAVDEPGTFSDKTIADSDCVIVLADQLIEDVDSDSQTLRVLLRLKELAVTERSRCIVQLLQGSSRELVPGLYVDEAVVSSEVVSSQLAQIALHRSLGAVYPQLLSASDVEIRLSPLSRYSTSASTTFGTLSASANLLQETALGISRPGTDHLLLNPPADRSWQIEANDQLIVLKSSSGSH